MDDNIERRKKRSTKKIESNVIEWVFMADKMIVEVKIRVDNNGWNVPVELTYEDEKYEIKNPIRSMKLFNNAIRYRCNIDGKEIELFNEREDWWIFR